MIFLLFIGKNKFHLFDLNKNCERITINGSEFFPYDLTKAKDAVNKLIAALANDYNIASESEVQFQVLENMDSTVNEVMLEALGGHIQAKFNIQSVIRKILNVLTKDQPNLRIKEFGINYDGNSFEIKNNKVEKEDFNLLSYTLDDASIINSVLH